MSVKIRPITKDDKLRMAPRSTVSRITSSPMVGLDKVAGLPNNVVSSTIFGRTSHNVPDEGDLLFEDRYTRVGYIELVKPVLNQFLAGRTAPVWKRVLGLKQDEIVSIINGNTIWEEGVGLVQTSSVGTKSYDPERYVFGADLLKMLLMQVDIDEVLNACLINDFILPVMTRNEKSDYKAGCFNIGEIVQLDDEELAGAMQGDLDGWFYANYALDVSHSDFSDVPNESLEGMTRRDVLLEDIQERVMEYYTNGMSQYSIVDVMMMLKRDGVNALLSQILDYVFVLPYGYRPTIDGRIDALTSQYNKLVNANQELQDILDRKDPTIFTVINKYREIVQLVRNIFIGDDYAINSQRLRDYKSISDSISGKEGLMRSRMQGARVDYSGRTVITCDPYMPIDMIGVPIKMLEKVAEPAVIRDLRKYKATADDKGSFSWRNLSTFSSTSSAEKDGITYRDFVKMWFENGGKYDRYGLTGRQPTLFYLGIQGLRVIPVEGDAMILSPLIVMPFNADFDGDQMYFNFPVTLRGMAEARDQMSFKENMRYPKNGEITVVARHEILYGLWVCKSMSEAKEGSTVNEQQLKDILSDVDLGSGGFLSMVYEAVCRQRLAVYDKVSTKNGLRSAGIIALEFAIYQGNNDRVDLSDPSFKVKAKDLTNRAMEYYGSNRTSFLSAINRMVRLGFCVAKVWPPNISVIVEQKTREVVQEMIEDFNERMLEREEFVNIGIETQEEFSSFFSAEWTKLEKDVIKYLSDNLGPDNGYVSMWKSGAKGDQNNIRQIFGLKGRVQKNDISTFNSIIAGSYSGQLTGMEHFITAYGSHQGIADKVLATAMPGYLSRRLEHAASIINVTYDDCGTDEGIEFTLEDIVPFIDESQVSKFGVYPDRYASEEDKKSFWKKPETVSQLDAGINYLAKILVGRYIILDDGSSIGIPDEITARHYIRAAWSDKSYGVIKMRSILYCKKPCCRYCYGRDLAAGLDLPNVGRPIGFIAAQAIGEPGTQMTMKNFQKGGVVSEANLTSSFDLINDYFELYDFGKKRKNKRGVISYDRLSPVEGYVKEQYLGNGGKRIIVTATSDENDRKNLIPGTTKIIVHENTILKEYVRVGDSFQKIQGDLNMKEVLRYRGYDKAAMYLSLMLYNIFLTQDVNFKHFETIVAGMTVMTLVADATPQPVGAEIPYGEGSRMVAGSVLTLPEMGYGVQMAAGFKTILGLKNLPKYKLDFFESLLMENMNSNVPRSVLMNPNDSMSNPITRTAFGLNIGIGTDMARR